jgi:hypothetical protein
MTKVKKNLFAAVKIWAGWMVNHGIHFRVKVTANL